MRTEINPQETTRATAFELWMSSPMPMVTLVKILDVPHCHRSTRFSVGLSFLHPRFLHPKGHPFPPYFITKTAAISTIFPHFLHFPPSFPLADKKVSDFAVLYSIENQGVSFKVETPSQGYDAKTVIIATGNKKNSPQIKGIKEFEGKGISYCAICDSFFFRNKSRF